MVENEAIDPSQIHAPTFSKETASNMGEKVEKLLQGKEVIIKTFHSFCVELCGVNRYHAARLLKKLVLEGLLIPQGTGRSAHYDINRSFK